MAQCLGDDNARLGHAYQSLGHVAQGSGDNNQHSGHMAQCLGDVNTSLGHAYQGLVHVAQELGDNNFCLVFMHLALGVLLFPLVLCDTAHDDLHDAHFCPARHRAQRIDQKLGQEAG